MRTRLQWRRVDCSVSGSRRGAAISTTEWKAPIRPRIFLSSARYQVARDNWNDVSTEVYYDAKHPWNVGAMQHTAKTALEYYSREFAPYMYPYFRIVEYPGYEDHAQAFPGTVPYTETVGFLTDLSSWAPLDLATAHELAHMWWGGLAYGARMQGRKILNEGLAEYSTLMLFKQQQNPLWLRQMLAERHDALSERPKGCDRGGAAGDPGRGRAAPYHVRQVGSCAVRAAGADRRGQGASGPSQLSRQVCDEASAVSDFAGSGEASCAPWRGPEYQEPDHGSVREDHAVRRADDGRRSHCRLAISTK